MYSRVRFNEGGRGAGGRVKLAELMQSWVGKVGIAAALFAAGYYFPLFGPAGTAGPPAASAASASPTGASAATSPR